MRKIKNYIYIVGFAITIAGLIWNFSYSYGVLNEKIKALEKENNAKEEKLNKIYDKLESMNEKIAKLEAKQDDMKELLSEIKNLIKNNNKRR